MKTERNKYKTCSICNEQFDSVFNSVPYCKRHYLQMYRYGKVFNRTIYDKNEYILYDTYAEILLYDKEGEVVAKTKIDLDKVNDLKQYKIYRRKHGGDKYYVALSYNNKKILLHRYLLNLHNEEYTLNKAVDHINGDSLDNRIQNLRICKHSDNMKNIRKKDKIIGVGLLKSGKYCARIMHNYQHEHIGQYDTEKEAIFARVKREHELFGEFGPNKDLYYLLDHGSTEESV